MTMTRFLPETPVRWCRGPRIIPVVLVCLCGSFANTATAGASKDEEATRTVKVTTEARLFVRNTRGKTIIVGRKDADEVRVRIVKVVRAKDDKTAARWMDELQYEVGTNGEEVSVVTHHPERTEENWSFWTFLKRIKDKAYIDYTIEVPAGFDVKVSTTSGDVKITSVEGDVRVFGSSGDVFIKGIGGDGFIEMSSGKVEAEDIGKDLYIRMSSGGATVRSIAGSVSVQGTSGDVEINGVGGDADVEVSSGDLVLKGCRGDASIKSHGGDLDIGDVGGSITASATAGDIDVSLTPVGPRKYAFDTSSGDVDVTFDTPEGYGFSLEVETSSGAIEGNLDIRLDEVSRKTLRGVAGNGEGLLRIETASGNIRIKQKGK
jgi:DUF4097 and DUF4098 domain-containing protein YvlB